MPEKPRLFVASSSEALSVAEAVLIRLETAAQVSLWDNAFDLSTLTLPTLLARSKDTDFAVFVFHRDDKTIIRSNIYSTVRDNVLFELGLFVGALGIEHCFVLLPRSSESEFRLPSDLAGLTVATYNDTLEDMVGAVTASCAKIKQSIQRLSAPPAVPEAPTAISPARTLESELWRARTDLQRANESSAAMLAAIQSQFFAIAKPATAAEIAAWEEGAKTTYPDQPKIHDHSVFFVDQDIVIPPLFGARSLTLLVASGVRVFGLEQRSHNSVYFMDGFRKLD